MIAFLSGTTIGRWMLGATALIMVVGAVVIRAYFGGKAAAGAQAAAETLKRTLEGAHAREQEKRNPTDPSRDPYNRDNWRR